jgi:hypothetical protein
MSVLPFMPRLPAFAPLHPLGRGPLGEWVSLVWPLEQAPGEPRPLVVKTFLLTAGLPPEALRPLEDALARALPLRHAGIARLHGFQVDVRDTLTVVSDYVPGCSLATARRRVAARGGRLSEAFVCHVGAAVAEALHAAHASRGVHGDVQAHHIRLGPRGEVTLTDFGLGAARPLLRREEVCSRPERAAEAREDLRALGRVLLELLSGRTLAPRGAGGVDALGAVSPALRSVLLRLLVDGPCAVDSGEKLRAELRACAERLGGSRDGVVRELAALPGSGPLSPVDAYVGAASVMAAPVAMRERVLKS